MSLDTPQSLQLGTDALSGTLGSTQLRLYAFALPPFQETFSNSLTWVLPPLQAAQGEPSPVGSKR